MPAASQSGIHFTNLWEFMPFACPVADLLVQDSGAVGRASSTTAFFTEMARRGLQDQTNWTAGTPKTLLSIPSGKGFVAAIVGPTAGGAETTTFEATVNGAVSTVVVNVTSGQRAVLFAKTWTQTDYTSADQILNVNTEAIGADKATFTPYTTSGFVPAWRSMAGYPMLKFKTSLLIRATHSASITNSTATAYSAIMYRQGL